MSRKSDALAAVVTATEQVVAAEWVWGSESLHADVSRQGVADSVANARAAGATDDDMRAAVDGQAFGGR